MLNMITSVWNFVVSAGEAELWSEKIWLRVVHLLLSLCHARSVWASAKVHSVPYLQLVFCFMPGFAPPVNLVKFFAFNLTFSGNKSLFWESALLLWHVEIWHAVPLVFSSKTCDNWLINVLCFSCENLRMIKNKPHLNIFLAVPERFKCVHFLIPCTQRVICCWLVPQCLSAVHML